MAGAKQSFAAKLDSIEFAKRRPELWKFIKASAGGLAASLPGFAAYMVLVPFLTRHDVALPNFFFFNFLARHMRESAAYTIPALVYGFIISSFIGQTLSFFPNRKLAFRADNNVALSTFLMILLALFTIFANGILGPAIATIVFQMSFLPDGVLNSISKFLSICSATIWCYPANRFLIHRVRKPKEDSRE